MLGQRSTLLQPEQGRLRRRHGTPLSSCARGCCSRCMDPLQPRARPGTLPDTGSGSLRHVQQQHRCVTSRAASGCSWQWGEHSLLPSSPQTITVCVMHDWQSRPCCAAAETASGHAASETASASRTSSTVIQLLWAQRLLSLREAWRQRTEAMPPRQVTFSRQRAREGALGAGHPGSRAGPQRKGQRNRKACLLRFS